MTTTTLQKPSLSKPLEGVIWKIFSCFCFAGLNIIVRYLTGGAGDSHAPLSASEIACLQNVIGSLLVLPYFFKEGMQSLKTSFVALHSLRVLIGVSGIILLYQAFSLIPVAQAVALGFTGPIFTVIGAWIFLKERMGSLRFLGILLGFLGAFIISRPDHALLGEGTSLGWTALLPLGAAFAFAISKLLGRSLSTKGESPKKLTFYLMFFMAPASLPLALSSGWVWPNLEQWGLLGLLGLFAWSAHYSMAKSFSLADITFLTPFGFARLLFSALFAYLIFGENPHSYGLWMGAFIIMISTICIAYEEATQKKCASLLKH